MHICPHSYRWMSLRNDNLHEAENARCRKMSGLWSENQLLRRQSVAVDDDGVELDRTISATLSAKLDDEVSRVAELRESNQWLKAEVERQQGVMEAVGTAKLDVEQEAEQFKRSMERRWAHAQRSVRRLCKELDAMEASYDACRSMLAGVFTWRSIDEWQPKGHGTWHHVTEGP